MVLLASTENSELTVDHFKLKGFWQEDFGLFENALPFLISTFNVLCTLFGLSTVSWHPVKVIDIWFH